MKNSIGICLILIPSLLLLGGLFKKNESFFGLREVFENQFRLFKNARLQYLNFVVYPLLISVGMAFFYVPQTDFYEQLNVTLSIFVSLLIAILGVITSKNYDEEKKKKIIVVHEETCNTIIFSVCLCLLLMIISFSMMIISNLNNDVRTFMGIISVYFLLVILLNMLLIIKRIVKMF